MKFILLLALLVTPFSVLLALAGPDLVSGNTNTHDPSICKDGSGKYWLFSTSVGIEIRTSTDRIKWTLIGTVWPSGQDTWTDKWTGAKNGNIWAPDCHIVNGQFHLYYAASSFGSRKSAIYLAKSDTGLPGSWTSGGLVTSTATANNYNAIDPNLVIDKDGQWFLTLGSFGTGIKQMNLSSSTGKPTSSAVTPIARRLSTTAIEAGYIFATNGFYYLFTSWDLCCKGTSSTYNIRVTRSASVSGPYKDKSGVEATKGGGTLLLESHNSITGPGGQSVFKDTDGPILVYHYYTSTGSFLGLNQLNFTSGWPVIV